MLMLGCSRSGTAALLPGWVLWYLGTTNPPPLIHHHPRIYQPPNHKEVHSPKRQLRREREIGRVNKSLSTTGLLHELPN